MENGSLVNGLDQVRLSLSVAISRAQVLDNRDVAGNRVGCSPISLRVFEGCTLLEVVLELLEIDKSSWPLPAECVSWLFNCTEGDDCIHISPLGKDVSISFRRNEFLTVALGEKIGKEEIALATIRSALNPIVTLKFMTGSQSGFQSFYWGGFESRCCVELALQEVLKVMIPSDLKVSLFTVLDFDQLDGIDREEWPGKYWVLMRCASC